RNEECLQHHAGGLGKPTLLALSFAGGAHRLLRLSGISEVSGAAQSGRKWSASGLSRFLARLAAPFGPISVDTGGRLHLVSSKAGRGGSVWPPALSWSTTPIKSMSATPAATCRQAVRACSEGRSANRAR